MASCRLIVAYLFLEEAGGEREDGGRGREGGERTIGKDEQGRQSRTDDVNKKDGKDVTVEDQDGVAAKAKAAGRKFVPWYMRAGLKKGGGKGSGKAKGTVKGKDTKGDKGKGFVPWYLKARLKKKGKDSGKGKRQSGKGRGKGKA